MKNLVTVTGKPITVTAACRLPIPLYEAAQLKAKSEGVSLSTLLERWITERLEQGDAPGLPVEINADVPQDEIWLKGNGRLTKIVNIGGAAG